MNINEICQHLTDYVNANPQERFYPNRDERLVAIVRKGDLALFNYTDKCQYDNIWNEIILQCRGLIVDVTTGKPVAIPFPKFFNWGEYERCTTAEIQSVSEKVDGTLGIVYEYEGELWVATRGSFDSQQAQWATEYLRRIVFSYEIQDQTWLVEIVYPEDRKVVNYKDERKVVMLGGYWLSGEEFSRLRVEHICEEYGLQATPCYDLNTFHTMRNVEHIKKICQNQPVEDGLNWEGFVVKFQDGQLFKFKGAGYIALHRAVAHLDHKHVWEVMQKHERVSIPDELLPELEKIEQEVRDEVSGVLIPINNFYEMLDKSLPRKELALQVTAWSKQYVSVVFGLLDGRNVLPILARCHKFSWEQ